MSVYRFKITFEDYEEVSREIEIKSSQTFEDLHYAIQSAIGFDASQPASFYMSNDHWTKGQEISLQERPSRNRDENVLMKDALLVDWIVDPHQKIYYEFDYNSQWTFYVELVRIIPLENHRAKYPQCVKTTGEAPKQRTVFIPVKEVEEDMIEVMIDDSLDESASEDEPVTEEVIDEEEADAITDEEGLSEEEGTAEEEK